MLALRSFRFVSRININRAVCAQPVRARLNDLGRQFAAEGRSLLILFINQRFAAACSLRLFSFIGLLGHLLIAFCKVLTPWRFNGGMLT
jgi:hypothetical protein